MEIRDLTQDDFDAALDIRMRSFGPLSDSDREKWRAAAIGAVAAGRYIGVYDGDRLTAVARLRAFTQWWHGRPQPMAGIGSVTVSPEERGKGVGTLLMKGVIERAAELGDAISALYPATTPIYRSVGYEHAGAQNTITLKTEALRRIRPTGQVKLRRMGPDDAAELIEVMGRANAAARVSGPISLGRGHLEALAGRAGRLPLPRRRRLRRLPLERRLHRGRLRRGRLRGDHPGPVVADRHRLLAHRADHRRRRPG